MDIIQKMADPELIANMAIGEKLLGTLVVMLLGLGTCFIVLCVIMLCIRIMSKIFGQRAPAVPASVPVPVAPVAAPVAAPIPQGQPVEDDEELVAVITAAIAAFEGGGNFRIKSIREKKKASPALSAWVSAGRAEAFASRSVIKK